LRDKRRRLEGSTEEKKVPKGLVQKSSLEKRLLMSSRLISRGSQEVGREVLGRAVNRRGNNKLGEAVRMTLSRKTASLVFAIGGGGNKRLKKES